MSNKVGLADEENLLQNFLIRLRERKNAFGFPSLVGYSGVSDRFLIVVSSYVPGCKLDCAPISALVCTANGC